jgi:hypothetical protein
MREEGKSSKTGVEYVLMNGSKAMRILKTWWGMEEFSSSYRLLWRNAV